MKLFKHIILFLVLSVLFKVTVSAENLSLTETSIDNSVKNDHSAQSISSLGIHFYIGTEVESLVSISQPEHLPLVDVELSKKDGLLNRSLKLSLAFGSSFQNYARNFFNISFIKEIIFPFHSFW